MDKIGFDNEQYLKTQSKHIKERIAKFGGKLYLEFGGKLFDDHHASRVLPGFQPDSKIRMLGELKDDAEIVIAIHAGDIEKNKVRGDLGITYDYVGYVVLTRFSGQEGAIAYQKKLEALGIKVYRHYSIPSYPSNVPLIISEDGFGKNEYIETSRSLIVVTAPGPGSGKMAVCLSQLYQEHRHGINAGYAKFETFPIWNIPLQHPVNLAYEAATADLNDVNLIEPYHLEAYGVSTVNYNRDVEVFPVLKAMFNTIYGSSPYESPTDMGVNMAGNCIIDDEAVRKASQQEIIRRYYHALVEKRKGSGSDSIVEKEQLLMEKANVSGKDRPVISAALQKAELTGAPAAAISLPNGSIVTGKTSSLLGACSAMLLNALKVLAGLPDDLKVISPEIIEPIQHLKVEHLGNHNPRLHTDEILIALTISANTDPNAEKCMEQLVNLNQCEMHSTVILSQVDEKTRGKLGIRITSEPQYQIHSKWSRRSLRHLVHNKYIAQSVRYLVYR